MKTASEHFYVSKKFYFFIPYFNIFCNFNTKKMPGER